MAAIARSFTEPTETSTPIASWCFLLLDQLEDFATLAWYLLADGKLVEEVFSRTMTHLESIPFDSSDYLLAHNKVRRVLIAQSIALLETTRKAEDENQCVDPIAMGDLPDLPRLALMLRMVIRSSATELAECLGVSTSEARELVSHAIDHLSLRGPALALSGPGEA